MMAKSELIGNEGVLLKVAKTIDAVTNYDLIVESCYGYDGEHVITLNPGEYYMYMGLWTNEKYSKFNSDHAGRIKLLGSQMIYTTIKPEYYLSYFLPYPIDALIKK